MAKKKSQSSSQILVENVNLGGIADSIYMGMPNSVASSVGFDHHSIPGVMLVNQKFTVESGGAPTDDLYTIVPAKDGTIYLFGKTTGKVYQNTSGTYTLRGTVSPAAGSIGISSAIELGDNLYYAMQNRLGQWNINQAFSARNDNFGTFANGSSYHPVVFVPNQQAIYFGDQSALAQVNTAGSFAANAFTSISDSLNVDCIGFQGSDILIGASARSQMTKSFILRWNGWSPVATTAYPINEPSINAFFPSEDEVIVNCGLSGNLYHLNGSVFEIIKQIPPIFPNTYSPSNKVTVNAGAIANKQGIPLFGVSNSGGNVALQGIYSYGHRNPSYPKILSLEVPISTGVMANVTVWSIAGAGNDVYVSWNDTNAATFGIDKLDWSNKYTAPYFETRLLTISHEFLDMFDNFIVNLAQTLPTGTQVNVSYKINNGSYVAWSWNSDTLSDVDRNQAITTRRIDARTLQVKVAPTVSGNNAPMIENFLIEEGDG